MESPNPYSWTKFAVGAVPVLAVCFLWLKQRGRPTPGIIFLEFVILSFAMWWWDRRRKRFDGKDLPESNRKTLNQRRMLGLGLLVIGTILAATRLPMNATLGALFTIGGVIVIFKK